jgi:phosphoglycolate phosphatase
MPKRFDLLIFDWDGTLMDSAAAISASIQAACSDLDFPVPSDQDARYIIGLGLRDAMAHILPGLTDDDYGRIVERYRHHFIQRDAGTTLFEGVTETVRELHAAGHILAVATGKSRRGLDRALAATGLSPYFRATRCADEGASKPDPAMLECLLDTVNVGRDRALMIGDTTHDLQMARSAKVAGIGAAYGAHPKRELLRFSPLACFDEWGELSRWLAANA